jgi:hypothetical protein
VNAALIGAGQIAGQHLSCLKALPGIQDAGSGILLLVGRSAPNHAFTTHGDRE